MRHCARENLEFAYTLSKKPLFVDTSHWTSKTNAFLATVGFWTIFVTKTTRFYVSAVSFDAKNYTDALL